jgi:DNA-binding NarL/FixJ family response regulator
MSLRIIVAEDQTLVRAGLVTILSTDPELMVAGEAANGQEAVDLVRRERPDIALVDVRMPVMDGMAATRRIIELAPDTRVVMLTTFGEDEVVFEALRSGASGFLLKDSRPEALIAAVHAVGAGEARLDPAVTGTVVAHFRTHAAPRPSGRSLDGLTPREREVLVLIARGRSNAEIASELVVSAGTVKTHVASLLAKLGVRDRVQAVIAAYESGLVEP